MESTEDLVMKSVDIASANVEPTTDQNESQNESQIEPQIESQNSMEISENVDEDSPGKDPDETKVSDEPKESPEKESDEIEIEIEEDLKNEAKEIPKTNKKPRKRRPGDNLSCSVFQCKPELGVSFHRFPKKDLSLLLQWIEFCKRDAQINVNYARICGKHFHPDCFNGKRDAGCGNYKPSLHIGSVPTLFGPEQTEKKKNSRKLPGYKLQRKEILEKLKKNEPLEGLQITKKKKKANEKPDQNSTLKSFPKPKAKVSLGSNQVKINGDVLKAPNLFYMAKNTEEDTYSKFEIKTSEKLKAAERCLAEQMKKEKKLDKELLQCKNEINRLQHEHDSSLELCFQYLISECYKHLRRDEIYWNRKLCFVHCSVCAQEFHSDEELTSHFLTQHSEDENVCSELSTTLKEQSSKVLLPPTCPLLCIYQPKNELDFVQHLEESHFKKNNALLRQEVKRKRVVKDLMCPLSNCLFKTGFDTRLLNHKLLHLDAMKKTENFGHCEKCKDKTFKSLESYLEHQGVFHLLLTLEKVHSHLNMSDEVEKLDGEVQKDNPIANYIDNFVVKEEEFEAVANWNKEDPLDRFEPIPIEKLGEESKTDSEHDKQINDSDFKQKAEGSNFLRCKQCPRIKTVSTKVVFMHYHNMHPDFISEAVEICKLEHPTLKCGSCGFACDDDNVLDIHLDSHKYKLICEVCGQKSKYMKVAKAHYLDNHETVFPCEICGIVKNTYTSYKDHKHTHSEKRTACEICGKLCKSRSLLYHKTLCHSKPLQCEECPYRTGSRKIMKRHTQNMHEGGLPYDKPCKVCGKLFNRDWNRIVHYKRVHQVDPKTLEPLAVNCNRSTTREKKVRPKKTRRKKEPTVNVCQLCGNKFTQGYNLCVHYRKVHKVHHKTLEPLDTEEEPEKPEKPVKKTAKKKTNKEKKGHQVPDVIVQQFF